MGRVASGKRARRSAGLLVYRRRAATLEVFLVHPGGPFWRRRDAGAWSIPKGEPGPEEPESVAARREFFEETGLVPNGPSQALTELAQPGGKHIAAWAVEDASLDADAVRSNCFALEWPPGSGVWREFPEVDRAAWFPLEEAHVRLIAGQRPFLDELAAQLAAAGGAQRRSGSAEA